MSRPHLVRLTLVIASLLWPFAPDAAGQVTDTPEAGRYPWSGQSALHVSRVLALQQPVPAGEARSADAVSRARRPSLASALVGATPVRRIRIPPAKVGRVSALGRAGALLRASAPGVGLASRSRGSMSDMPVVRPPRLARLPWFSVDANGYVWRNRPGLPPVRGPRLVPRDLSQAFLDHQTRMEYFRLTAPNVRFRTRWAGNPSRPWTMPAVPGSTWRARQIRISPTVPRRMRWRSSPGGSWARSVPQRPLVASGLPPNAARMARRWESRRLEMLVPPIRSETHVRFSVQPTMQMGPASVRSFVSYGYDSETKRFFEHRNYRGRLTYGPLTLREDMKVGTRWPKSFKPKIGVELTQLRIKRRTEYRYRHTIKGGIESVRLMESPSSRIHQQSWESQQRTLQMQQRIQQMQQRTWSRQRWPR